MLHPSADCNDLRPFCLKMFSFTQTTSSTQLSKSYEINVGDTVDVESYISERMELNVEREVILMEEDNLEGEGEYSLEETEVPTTKLK